VISQCPGTAGHLQQQAAQDMRLFGYCSGTRSSLQARASKAPHAQQRPATGSWYSGSPTAASSTRHAANWTLEWHVEPYMPCWPSATAVAIIVPHAQQQPSLRFLIQRVTCNSKQHKNWGHLAIAVAREAACKPLLASMVPHAQQRPATESWYSGSPAAASSTRHAAIWLLQLQAGHLQQVGIPIEAVEVTTHAA
jgi:hypothetical protein